jgi:two-component system cell cycle response regulator
MKTEERKQVLIVDDNKNLLKGLSDFLKFKQFDVVTAASGEEGLQKLQTSKPDIILLDLAMPGMGGTGFLKRITAADGKRSYPVLVFTARSTTKEFFESIAVDGFIAKPCDKNELVERMEEILSRCSQSVASGGAPPRKTALVGEDDPAVASHLVESFRNAGYQVEVVASGPEVVEKAAVIQPSVIVVKHILPRMNGNAVVSLLRDMSRTRSIPVVLYEGTSVVKKEEDEKYVKPECGIKEYLMSDDAADLLKAAEDILAGGGRRQPAATPATAPTKGP